MSTLVEINNTTLGIKEFNGQRVIAFKDIDMVHERPDGTARKSFNRNRTRMIEFEDFFIVKPKDLENVEMGTKCPTGIYQVNPRGTTFITETGYLMLVKTFDDDLAWQVQRQLVSNYFKVKDSLDSGNNKQFTRVLMQMTDTLFSINDRLSALEKTQNKPKPLPANKYSRWKSTVFNKIKLIQSYVNDNSDQDLSLPQTMKLIFDELQDIYDIDLSEYSEMYKCEYGLDFDTKVQTLDVINHYKDIRDTFTLTLNSILDRLHIQNNDATKFQGNIFDELAAQLLIKWV